MRQIVNIKIMVHITCEGKALDDEWPQDIHLLNPFMGHNQSAHGHRREIMVKCYVLGWESTRELQEVLFSWMKDGLCSTYSNFWINLVKDY